MYPVESGTSAKNGFPLLDVVGNRDVAEEMADVSVTFTLCS